MLHRNLALAALAAAFALCSAAPAETPALPAPLAAAPHPTSKVAGAASSTETPRVVRSQHASKLLTQRRSVNA
jgi:hypothetical protein